MTTPTPDPVPRPVADLDGLRAEAERYAGLRIPVDTAAVLALLARVERAEAERDGLRQRVDVLTGAVELLLSYEDTTGDRRGYRAAVADARDALAPPAGATTPPPGNTR
jgi:hypothetical protein